MEVCARAVLIRIDLRHWGGCERRYRHLAVHSAAFVVVDRRHRWRGHECRVAAALVAEFFIGACGRHARLKAAH